MSLAETWDRFAKERTLRRAVNARGQSTWLNWTQYPDHGPDEGVLGTPLAGLKVLELGSGNGDNLAHLATLGATCTGVDVAPSREAAARERWGHLPGLDFRTAEAVDYLTTEAATFDVVLSIFGAVWFVDPDELLPLVRARMNDGGVLAFSHLPADSQELKPGRAGMRHDHTPDEWTEFLHRHGFTDVRTEIIEPPAGQSAATMLIRATV
ncbi:MULTISPECIES: class I SAM-dependent methyltransferase [unclassified Streptomyces]|uniref:class I SAM-dependent methyltransferase n=1 Tax=unclassified Streptomyces TaxID=2593676 RepID=UPI0022577841|nr:MULTISPECIES: class I SAM-dependent methyltransferase [unclassified Streptomyces]MCX4827623.1 class I SAM-dependent methyltransferase [Streptomyces sp. NBC_01016]